MRFLTPPADVRRLNRGHRENEKKNVYPRRFFLYFDDRRPSIRDLGDDLAETH